MRAAIALGSNLPSRFGDSAANLREALHRLQSMGQVTAVSSFHQTEPVGYIDQPPFTNAAALLTTPLDPLDLLRGLLAIEQAMGRLRNSENPPKGPRLIDLDLLLYETKRGHSLVLDHPNLILPHPELHRRSFVLAPLAEIAPMMSHPTLNQNVGDLLLQLKQARLVPPEQIPR